LNANRRAAQPPASVLEPACSTGCYSATLAELATLRGRLAGA
jgi:hypothetical protein